MPSSMLLSQDSNPGVRLKALEGLKPLAGDPEVRKALRQVLLADDNVAVRMQVVDLAGGPPRRQHGRHDAGRRAAGKQQLRCASNWKRRLRDMNASVGTF